MDHDQHLGKMPFNTESKKNSQVRNRKVGTLYSLTLQILKTYFRYAVYLQREREGEGDDDDDE